MLHIQRRLLLLECLHLWGVYRLLVASSGYHFQHRLLLMFFKLLDMRRQEWEAPLLSPYISVDCIVPVRIDQDEEVWQFRFIEAGFS